MFGLLGKIFGSEKVISSGIALIDSLHTSTEEEIAAKTKAKTAAKPRRQQPNLRDLKNRVLLRDHANRVLMTLR